MDKENIIQFKRKYRACQGGIYHKGPYLYGSDDAFLECEACGGLITPMSLLKRLMNEESSFKAQLAELKIKVGKLKEKTKFKCGHCKKFTQLRR